MQRRQSGLKQANRRLPPNLTEAFSRDLLKTLDDVMSSTSPLYQDYWRAHFLSEHMLSKYVEDGVGTTSDERRGAAIAKWLSVEERNGIFNNLIGDPNYEWSHALYGTGRTLFDVLEKAKEIVLSVIGAAPSLDLAHASYSGGASTSKRRVDGHPAIKFQGRADSTRYAWKVCRDLFRGTRYLDYIHTGLEPRMVDGSILFTVPKSSVIDRVACKEPDINVFLQKMFGAQIRTLLLRKGINLNDQSINGELAREGSRLGTLATMDLSSASDSVTHGLVRRLLPVDWYYWLNAVRSHTISIDGESHRLNMFSSMGNGFTFELESLLFYSISRAVCYLTGVRGRISVYGDDIIVPTEATIWVQQALELIGFQVNREKTFSEGPFRESCGSWWWNGLDVKPFFLKEPIRRYTDLIKVLNSLARWAAGDHGVVDPRFEAIHEKYRTFIPANLFGGQDFASIEALVTGHKPRSRLQAVVQKKSHDHIGGYLQWLQTTANRKHAGEAVTISGSRTTTLYRRVRNQQVREDVPVFLSFLRSTE